MPHPRLVPVLCAVALAFSTSTTALADSGHAAKWHAFFGRVFPVVSKDFASIKGAPIPNDDVYATKAKFDPKLVANCHIFTTGYPAQWHMRCDSVGYNSLDALAADIGAALPGFNKGANVMGQPQWSNKSHQIYVTIVALGGILITRGDPNKDLHG
jgi:hypothetical protein